MISLLNKMLRYVLALVALCTSGLVSQEMTVHETSERILVSGGQLRLEVQKETAIFTVFRAGEKILETDEYTGFYVRRDSTLHFPSRILSHDFDESELMVSMQSANEAMRMNLRVSLRHEYFKLRLTTDDDVPNEQIGLILQLESLGHWYGGNVTSAHIWPLETGSSFFDPFYATSNQTSPIWLTSSGVGLFVDTYGEMGFEINRDNSGLFALYLNRQSDIQINIVAEENIVEAYHKVIQLVGIPQTVPPRKFFTHPIYNTWIEFFTEVHQHGVIEYARTIIEKGFPPGILMIDDGWATAYGDFEFDPVKFPDPARMVDELKSLGFKVALWVTPFIETEAGNFALLRKLEYLILDGDGVNPYITRWWNGDAALVDFSNPEAYNWYVDELNQLVYQYNLDGFKFDGGDAEYLSQPYRSFSPITPNEYTDLFASVGSHFSINEFRVSWLAQKRGLVQRLRDKAPNWSKEDGLNSLIPHGLTIGLIGYPYFCPDMVGGGLEGGFKDEKFEGLDPELFIRWTQASALMPMMQFSIAPWHLDAHSLEIVRKYVDLHMEFGDYIYELALESKERGTPIARPLFFRNPEDPNTYTISDQFMLGYKFLIAPVTERGKDSRDVYLPPGTWRDYWTGKLYRGNTRVSNYPAPIELLPIFVAEE